VRERKLIWTILSLTLVASVFSALNVQRANAVLLTVSISPASNTYNPGQQFTISINIANVLGLHAWQLKLGYAPTYLYTNTSLIQEGSFLSKNGAPTYFAPPFFGATYIQLGDLINKYDWVDGNGTLVTITFVVNQDWGYCNLEIYDLTLLDVDSNPIIPDSVTGGTFRNALPNAGICSVHQPLSLAPAALNLWFNTSTQYTATYGPFNVTVWNTGPGSQTFDVKFYYNSSRTWNATADPPTGFTQVGSTQPVTLAVMSSQKVQFFWSPSVLRAHPYNYTLTFLAKISSISGGDNNPDDNTKLLPLLVEVLMGGDCNGDGRINYKDLGILAVNYGKKIPPVGTGDPRADFNMDGLINYKDLGILAVAYGKTYS